MGHGVVQSDRLEVLKAVDDDDGRSGQVKARAKALAQTVCRVLERENG